MPSDESKLALARDVKRAVQKIVDDSNSAFEQAGSEELEAEFQDLDNLACMVRIKASGQMSRMFEVRVKEIM